MYKRYRIALLALAIGLFAVPGLMAQSSTASDQVTASPGVARVSYINGQVSTLRGAAGTWVDAVLNAPLVVGDKISTGDNSRAEVELNYANVLRLAGRTEASITNLSNQQIQVQVAQGLVDYWVSKDNQANLEIDTPNAAVHPLEPGVYRVEVDSASSTKVTVRKGRAQISTPQGSAELKRDETMEVQGAENPQYQIVEAPAQDSWDRWNNQRDNVIASAQSWKYDNQYYTGTEDLDAYGHWENVPGYDWCWTPYIDEGWVPYSAGQWTWEPFYGWTWVSYEPWGWAPYHYGRWFFYGHSWMWWPGPVTSFYRPIWAPAYVSFFGFGRGGVGLGFGLGFGGFGYGRIGWLPIGPADPFCPWYGRGRFGYRMTNLADIGHFRNGNMPYFRPLAGAGRPAYSNFRAALTNARVRQGFVNMPANDFGRGAVGRFRTLGASRAEFRQASFVSGHVPIAPSRESLNFANRAVSRASLPSAAVNNRRFFSVQRPGAAPRSFSEQAANMRQIIQNNRSTSPRSGAQGFERGVQSYSSRSSQRAGNFSNGAAASRRQTQSGAGWQRFGSTGSGANRAGRASPQARGAYNRGSASPSAGPAGRSGARAGYHSFGSSPSHRSSPSSQYGRREESRPAPQVNRQGGSSHPAQSRSSHSRSGFRAFSNSGNASGARPQFRSRAYAGQSGAWRGSSRSFSSRSAGDSASYGARQGWSRFSPQARQSFDRSSGGFSRGYSKPSLNINRPVVSGRSGSGGDYRGSWNSGYYRPSYNSRGSSRGGFRGGYSRPSGGSHGGGMSRGGGMAHGGGGSRGGGMARGGGGHGGGGHGGGRR
ncbi:MAG: DUF6600 domain-containing protein [Terriglobia bacterium]